MAASTTNLVSWWTLEEASGARADSHGSNNLSDNGTVLQGTGVQGNCSDHEEGNNEFFDLATNSDLSFGDEDFTAGAWVKVENAGGADRGIMGKWDFGSSNTEWLIYEEHTDDRFGFFVSDDGSNTTVEFADQLGNVATGTWYFIIAWHDSVANTINIQVNDGTVDSQAYSLGVNNGAASTFEMGILGAAANTSWDGLIDEAFVYEAVLSEADRTWLYNTGSGRTYSDLDSGGAAASRKNAAMFFSLTGLSIPAATLAGLYKAGAIAL